jgi:alpha-glucosidase (family GH31 glycosyl hydrolase)
MKKQYIVDEIIDKKYAVLLDREDESKKLDAPLKDIPIKVKEGDIVNLEFKDNKIISAEVDIVATKKAREEIDKLLDELKKKGSDELKW